MWGYWIASRSLSSGAHSHDQVARNDVAAKHAQLGMKPRRTFVASLNDRSSPTSPA
jgi:hypothetical protein